MKRIAHIMAMLLGIAVLSGCKNGLKKSVTPDGTTYENSTDKPWSFRLPDGSAVLLSGHSSLHLFKTFADRREAELDGEALFEIVGEMVIHTRNLHIEAGGSRFHADAHRSSPGEQIDLLEGRLIVKKSYLSKSDNEAEMLDSGDMLMINRDIDLMEKEKMNPAELARTKGLAWPPR